MNKLIFSDETVMTNYMFYASWYNDGIVSYEFEDHMGLSFRTDKSYAKGQLSPTESKMFIELIEKTDIENLNILLEEERKNRPNILATDLSCYSVSVIGEYGGNAHWDGLYSVDNLKYLYLALSLCDPYAFNLLCCMKEGAADEFTSEPFKGEILCMDYDISIKIGENEYKNYSLAKVFNKQLDNGVGVATLNKIKQVFSLERNINKNIQEIDSFDWRVTLVNDNYDVYSYCGKIGENKDIDSLNRYLINLSINRKNKYTMKSVKYL